MFVHRSDAVPIVMFPGVTRRTMAEGERMMIVEVTLDKDAVVPPHRHVHEQAGYVAEGAMRFVVDGAVEVVCAGDSYCIPANATHEVAALESTVAIDVFSPPRIEYRPLSEAAHC